jgi:hypothetical protein
MTMVSAVACPDSGLIASTTKPVKVPPGMSVPPALAASMSGSGRVLPGWDQFPDWACEWDDWEWDARDKVWSTCFYGYWVDGVVCVGQACSWDGEQLFYGEPHLGVADSNGLILTDVEEIANAWSSVLDAMRTAKQLHQAHPEVSATTLQGATL